MRLAITLAALLMATAAHAQIVSPSTAFPNIPPGQTDPTKALNQFGFVANTPSQGYQEDAANPVVVGAGTTQATATVITTRANVVSCASGAGVILPALNHYAPITIINRGSNACLIYPTIAGQVESAPGTLAAVNTGVSLAAGADAVFRPFVIGGVVEWLM